MSSNKQVKCSICGQPIKTMLGAVTLSSTPITCRRCFGEQSYAGSSNWTQNVVVQAQPTSDG